MNELIKQLEQLLSEVQAALKQLNADALRQKIAELEKQMQAPGFWDDNITAAKTSQQHAQSKEQLEGWESLLKQVGETLELAKLGDSKLEKDLAKQCEDLKAQFEKREIELKLNGPHDASAAILQLHAGTGGTDAMDWTQMLERMYLRFGESHDYKTEVLSESAGEEAGLKTATLRLDGPFAYGKLKGEHGVHRLVRKSPFNSDNLRQTSFALVEVLPELDKPEELVIDEKDLRIDVFRAGGHGGQSVNTTDSAVRITHLPTNVTVSIQNERSQLQNKATAMNILRARLAKLQQEQQAAEMAELKGPNVKAEWGRQIRNYVLDPYKLVKDTRTNYETSQVEAVIDGELDEFIDSYLSLPINKA